MANIKYIRVSTKDQNTARQEPGKQVIDADTTQYDKVFTEKVSGKNTKDRPELAKLMAYVREGDTVTVESYSRFARSTLDLLNLVEELKNKGVQFISLKEKADTTTPQGKLIFTIFAGLAEFERELMLQRQAEGIAIAKAEGKYKGRQRIKVSPEQFAKQYKAWKEGTQTATEAMNNLNLKPNTFYRRVKEYEEGQNA